MRYKTKIVICIFSCFLLMSIPFINYVQANEVKKELKEKRDSIVNSFYTKLPSLKTKTDPNCIIACFSIIIILGISVWLIMYIAVFLTNLFYEILFSYITFEELIQILIDSIETTNWYFFLSIITLIVAIFYFFSPIMPFILSFIQIIWILLDILIDIIKKFINGLLELFDGDDSLSYKYH